MTESNKTTLLSRMRRAYQTGEVESVDEIGSTESAEVEEVSKSEEVEEAGALEELSEIERGIVDLAEQLLDESEVTDQEARRRILNLIVESRFGKRLTDQRRRDVVQTLSATLGEDAEFRKTIDKALIEASIKVGG